MLLNKILLFSYIQFAATLNAANSDHILPAFSDCVDKFLAMYFIRGFLDLEEIS